MALEHATPKFGGRWIDAADAEIVGKFIGNFSPGIDGVEFTTLEVDEAPIVLAEYGLDHLVTSGVAFLTQEGENLTKINITTGGAWFYFATKEQEGKG